MIELVENDIREYLLKNYVNKKINKTTIREMKLGIVNILMNFDLLHDTNESQHYNNIVIKSDPKTGTLNINFESNILDKILEKLKNKI